MARFVQCLDGGYLNLDQCFKIDVVRYGVWVVEVCYPKGCGPDVQNGRYVWSPGFKTKEEAQEWLEEKMKE